MENTKSTFKREGNITIYTRLLHASRELVWEAWTDPEHVKNWWGPDGFTLTNKAMDVRPGGTWTFTMHGMGMDFPNKVEFIEVKKPELLVYKHSDGEPDGFSFTTHITFEEQGENTLLTMKGIFRSEEELLEKDRQVNAIEGGKQHLGRLDAYVTQLKK